MTTVDGVRITEEMKEVLKNWQDEKFLLLDGNIEAIADAVCFIACEHECPKEHNEKEALDIIAGLSIVRKKLKVFTGKEYSNE